MNKRIVFVGLIILVLLGYILNFDKTMSTLFLNFTLDSRLNYSSSITSFKNSFNSYFNQVETLQKLEENQDKNKNYKILYDTIRYELNNLKQNMKIMDVNISHETIYTKALSYVNLNDFSKVILDKKLTPGKFYPLVTPQGYSAGVVKIQNNVSIGYLNSNQKSNYSVFVGLDNSPGITSGTDDYGNILIQHIPKWYTIKINDEVVTSGMDDIYPFGIKVGRVVDYKILLNTKMAIVKPYAPVSSKKYFFIITKINKPIITQDTNSTIKNILQIK